MKLKISAAICTIISLTISVSGQDPDRTKVVAGAERAFENTAKSVMMPAPGCAVGVSLNGESVFEKAFGLAEMEHNIPNTPQTIFESGSVAKQFTAAAIVLLSLDGKLRLDDPVRKYDLNAQGYIFWFTRDSSGKIDKMHIGTGRMRDMPFERVRK